MNRTHDDKAKENMMNFKSYIYIITTKSHYLRVYWVSRDAPCCAKYITHIHAQKNNIYNWLNGGPLKECMELTRQMFFLEIIF